MNPRCFALALTVAALMGASAAHAQNPRVMLETSLGGIIVELDADAAPITSENFLAYVNQGFYDGVVFHRVIDEFVIQGGGFDRNYVFREPTRDNIVNEGNNGRLNLPRTISMARATDPDSANSQFFFNLVHNDFLDGGYAVFGEVIGGWATVEEIAGLTTGRQITPIGGFDDSPITPPVIIRAFEFDQFPMLAAHTGSWFDPNNPGVGFNLEVTNMNREDDQPIVTVYWYDFSNGEQIWLTGTSGFDWGDASVTIDLLGVQTPAQADFQTPPPTSAFESRGSLTLSFNDCLTGRVLYGLDDFGIGEINVIRLSVPDRLDCSRFQLE